MISEIEKEFLSGLYFIVTYEGYSLEKVARYAYKFSLDNDITDSTIKEVVDYLGVMDVVPEFELSEDKFRKFIFDNLNIKFKEDKLSEIEKFFLKGIYFIVTYDGYSPEKVARYSYSFGLENDMGDSTICAVIDYLKGIDAGPEFELSEDEFNKFIFDNFNIKINEFKIFD